MRCASPDCASGASSSHSSGPSHSAARSPLTPARQAAAGSVTPSDFGGRKRTASSPRSTQRQAPGSERSQSVSVTALAAAVPAQVRH